MATWKNSWSRKIKLGWRKILWRTAKAKSETWNWKNEHTWSCSLWWPMEIRQIWRSGQNILHFWRLLSWPGKSTFSWIHRGWNLTKYNLNTLKFYPNPGFFSTLNHISIIWKWKKTKFFNIQGIWLKIGFRNILEIH